MEIGCDHFVFLEYRFYLTLFFLYQIFCSRSKARHLLGINLHAGEYREYSSLGDWFPDVVFKTGDDPAGESDGVLLSRRMLRFMEGEEGAIVYFVFPAVDGNPSLSIS